MASPIVEPPEVFSPKELEQLERWIRIYESPLGFVFGTYAERLFRKVDRLYFERTGQSEESYLNCLLAEVKQMASLRFTDGPNGANVTMFHFPEEQRAQAYKEFEADFVR